MAEKKKDLPLWKQAVLQVGAGGCAGFVEVCIMHPLDLVKTRLQLQKKTSTLKSSDVHIYNGVGDCFAKMYRHEGFLAFYKGIVPPILVETPKRAVKFFTFEQYKKVFLFGAPSPTPLTFSAAGFASGVTEAGLVTPFEVVKVTLQANKAKAIETPSTWSVAKQIIQNHGFGSRGLYKGFFATVMRGGVFNMVYFGFYHSVKDHFPTLQDPVHEFLRKIGLGFVSGTLASCTNIPFDVAKSRIQGPQPEPGVIKYKSTINTLRTVYIEEGWRALYKGLVPKIMRLGPGGAIMLLGFEYAYEFLYETFA
ncbi:unnamed protein product [Bemisia tabaci]|uniref:Mitochondrial 2-oxodicarboxylate carrier n=1 Tax=Bemisia tabaci TaxID=7038 RepID=A0A9P0ABH4_BEMTA|nr:PREDICTED: mitochondrial 2-oxodicarboxylate carrier [Bemisia tabaci]XP_018901661.1 PREDICTED: mitochondrial 2-oxodicarboxylate carrier [Bemisia tabaci]XP_018901662.1 PREDICTED: mitochondrial 2-oxodicarboxylate carrier [Bemisia tabaci]CAH0388194.1 unnamed protein product [Bemisia tabaci]